MQAKWMIGSAAGLALVAVAGIGAAQIGRQAANDAIPDVLIERITQNAVIEQYLVQIVGTLRSADRDGDGLDRGDVDLMRAQQLAQARASAVSQMLAMDLDGDFKATRDEMLRAARGEEPWRSQQVDNQLQRLDADGDGTVTLEEAAASARDPGNDRQIGELLALDPNKDGKLTAEELRRMAERAFASVDRDGDGRISPEEFAAIADRVREIQQARMAPACTLPPLPKGAQLIAYGGYEGDTISSAVIGGQDEETNLIDVTIEPGSTPLYLVLTSYESMVWRVSGDTGRVAQVVVSSQSSGIPRPRVPQKPLPAVNGRRVPEARTIVQQPSDQISASGVVGLPAEKVTISPPNCPRNFYKSDSGDTTGLASVRKSLGRAPDAVFTSYSAQRVSLPSGKITEAPDDSAPMPAGFDAGMWQEAIRFWPGGLAQVDPRQVVARARVEPYQVLPSQMGLSQLVGSGAVQHVSSDTFRIVRPIAHMPPSMGGAHSVKLILAQGVPMPPGDPLHSCVTSEDGKVSGRPGPRCGM